MEFRIIYLPSFEAISSGVDKKFDFSPNGVLGKFDAYFSTIRPKERDNFMPRDFLFYDEEKQGMVWWYAICDEIYSKDWEVVSLDGGYYLTYSYKDGDDEANSILYKKAIEYIEQSEYLELDVRPNHYPMGHIITPAEIIKAQGWAQMETFIPIKLKK